jgi:hypothetical protein
MFAHTGNVDRALSLCREGLKSFPEHASHFHMRSGLLYEITNNLKAARVEISWKILLTSLARI